MKIPYHIAQILKERKITDLLESRSTFPAKNLSDKIVYCCPLHKGDNDPSFTVYLDGEYQNYFCYGCKKGGNVINLLSELEGVPIKKSVSTLIEGMNINRVDAILSLMEALRDGLMEDTDDKMERMSFLLNRLCYDYLTKVDFAPEEVEFMDSVFKKIDVLIMNRDLEEYEEIENFISTKGLHHRLLHYLKEKEKELISDKKE